MFENSCLSPVAHPISQKPLHISSIIPTLISLDILGNFKDLVHNLSRQQFKGVVGSTLYGKLSLIFYIYVQEANIKLLRLPDCDRKKNGVMMEISPTVTQDSFIYPYLNMESTSETKLYQLKVERQQKPSSSSCNVKSTYYCARCRLRQLSEGLGLVS